MVRIDVPADRQEGLDLIGPDSTGGIRSYANDLLAFLAANLGYAETPLDQEMSTRLKVSFPVPHSPVDMHLGWGTVSLKGADTVQSHWRDLQLQVIHRVQP
jgi:hypothetical protein